MIAVRGNLHRTWKAAVRGALGIMAAACASLALVPPLLAAQEPEQKSSVAEAARRAREQKKAAPKAARVWDNDTLPKASGGAVNIVGAAPAPSAAAPAAQAGGGEVAETRAAETSEKERPLAQGELEEAKQRLADAEKELDLLQRSFDLQRQQFYSNPQYERDPRGKANLDALRADIETKKHQVSELKERVAALEAGLRSQPAPPPMPQP